MSIINPTFKEKIINQKEGIRRQKEVLRLYRSQYSHNLTLLLGMKVRLKNLRLERKEQRRQKKLEKKGGNK